MSSKHSSSSDRDRRSLPDDNGPMFQVGTVMLNRYQVVAYLGGGGMGEVYRCHDRVSDIDVALKVLPRDLSANVERMNDIRANFKLVECLHHPNIADLKTLEHNPATNDYYMIMEYVHGRTLRQFFKSRKKSRTGGMTLKEALPVLRQIAAALDFAHSQQVVHRDIKPANVMLMDNGTVKVLDFGIASRILIYTMANQGQRFFSRSGTGPYMAPEQWRAQYQDKVTDQYALAVVAYEMLVLEPPFQNLDQDMLKEAVLHDNPPTIAHAPFEVMKVLRRALAKKRKDRYRSCTAFVEALAAAGSESEGAVPVARATRVRPAKVLIGAGIILLLAALGCATWLIWPSPADPIVCAASDLKKGNFAHALLDAGKVLAKHPDNKQALSLRQEATNLQDLMQKAQSIMQTLKRARESVRKGRYAEAETLVRQVLQVQPGNAEAASLLQEIKKHVAREEALRAQAEKTRTDAEEDRQKLKDRMENKEFEEQKRREEAGKNLQTAMEKARTTMASNKKNHITNGQRQVQAWLKKTAKPPSAAETPAPTTSPVTNGPMAGKPWKAPGINMEFVWIPVKKGKLWAGKYEVTNGEFRRFKSGHQSDSVDGYDISLNGSRQPVVNVSYGDAEAFAQWLTSQAQGTGSLPEGFQYRLPSGEEWGILAQCGDGRDYPWGNEWPPTRGNYYDQAAAKRFGTKFGGAINVNDGYETTCPVELSDSNDWGLFGVGGNASEWTSEQNAGRRMVRGMSWRDSVQDNMRCGSKLSVDPDKRANNIGFRLVLTGP